MLHGDRVDRGWVSGEEGGSAGAMIHRSGRVRQSRVYHWSSASV